MSVKKRTQAIHFYGTGIKYIVAYSSISSHILFDNSLDKTPPGIFLSTSLNFVTKLSVKLGFFLNLVIRDWRCENQRKRARLDYK